MMRKITLIALIMIAFAVSGVKAQVLLDEPLTDGQVPAGWTNLDEDGVSGDAFFTDQGLWSVSEWSPVNFGGAFGVAFYAAGEFSAVPTTASDWFITDAVTLGPSSDLTFEVVSIAPGCTFEVRVATSLAGATPVASDFTNLVLTPVMSGSQAWEAQSVNLAAYSNQTVYIAFVNTTVDATTGNQVKLMGLRNILVNQPVSEDARASVVEIVGLETNETDYLVNNLSYANYSCLGDAAATISITVVNDGINSISTFDVAYQVDIDTPVVETVSLTTPLATGDSYTHTFTVPADFLTAGDPLYGLSAWVVLAGELNPVNDTTFIDFVITPQGWDFNNDGNYEDNFDRIDFNSGSLQNFETSWAWTFIDANNDGVVLNMTPDIAGDPLSGDFTLFYLWNTNGTTGADDYAFTQCMSLEMGYGYKLSVNAACGDDNGTIYEESFRFVRNTTPSNVGATIVGEHDVVSGSYEEFSSSFVVPSDADYYIGIHANSPADRWFLNLEDFSIERFDSAPTAGLTISGSDELNGSVYVDYCDSTVTISSTTTGVYDSVTVDWGDGNVETLSSSSATHQYTSLGSYTVVLTAINILGSSTSQATVEVVALPAPTVTFTTPTQNGTTVTATVGSSTGTTNIVYSPSCGATIVVNWGDGSIEQYPAGTTSVSHTYSSAGSYTISTTVLNSTGTSAAATQSVTVTGITNVNFASALEMFPNPANNLLNVSFELAGTENVELSIVSVDGKVIEVSSLNNVKNVTTSFNTVNLNNGVYILKIKTENGLSTQKFVVNHN